MNILLVEDESNTAAELAKYLRTSGHLVTVASSCADARWLGGHFDVGVFDLLLFDDSSLELARELLAAGPVRSALLYSGRLDGSAFDAAVGLVKARSH